jgi:hypothetical protein
MAAAEEGSRVESGRLVPRTESSPTLPSLSLGLLGGVPDINFFHGPGESAESSGLGSGVMSPMAAMMGLPARLLAPLAVPPSACPRAALTLGVRVTWRLLLEVVRSRGAAPRAALLPLREPWRWGVLGIEETRSVDMRSAEDGETTVSEGVESLRGGGGEAAMVLDWNCMACGLEGGP